MISVEGQIPSIKRFASRTVSPLKMVGEVRLKVGVDVEVTVEAKPEDTIAAHA
jgi:hypothetical protein